MSFFKGFAQGFAEQTGENIKRRNLAAEQYFEKSMAKAMEYSTSAKTANAKLAEQSRQAVGKLRTMGAPDDVIRAVSSQNPDELDDFVEQLSKAQLNGVEMTPEILRGYIKVSKEAGQSAPELLRNNREALENNIKADPEGFNMDSVGSIWSTIMGYNAMSNAQARLEETMIGDKSAADWMRQGASGDVPTFDTGAVLDYEALGDDLRQAEIDQKVDEPFKPKDYMDIKKQYDTIVEDTLTDWRSRVSGAERAEMIGNPEYKRLAEEAARGQLATMGYSPADLDIALGEQEVEEETPVEDEDDPTLDTPPTPPEQRQIGERRRSPRDGVIRTWDGNRWM